MIILGQETGAGGQRRPRAPPAVAATPGRSTRGASRRRLEDELGRAEGGPQTSDSGSSDSSGVVGWTNMQEQIREKNKSRKLHIGTTQGGLCSFILLPDGIADCEIKLVPVPEGVF